MAGRRGWIGCLLASLARLSIMLTGWAAIGVFLGWALGRQGALLGAAIGLLGTIGDVRQGGSADS